MSGFRRIASASGRRADPARKARFRRLSTRSGSSLDFRVKKGGVRNTKGCRTPNVAANFDKLKRIEYNYYNRLRSSLETSPGLVCSCTQTNGGKDALRASRPPDYVGGFSSDRQLSATGVNEGGMGVSPHMVALYTVWYNFVRNALNPHSRTTALVRHLPRPHRPPS